MKCSSLNRPQRFTLVAATIVSVSIGQAHAQSSVTLYGLVSVGVGYLSNQNGKSEVSLVNGPEQLPRFGLKGQEELGGGYRAIFTLENGFSITNGTLGQGGRLFGRQAFVGLENEQYGTLTAGRQYDEMVQQLYWTDSAVQFASFYARIGDSDNIFNTLRFNNSIRYKSPSVAGINLAGQYAFSNSATGFSDNSGYSMGVTYQKEQLRGALAVAQYNRPASITNTAGAIDNSSYGFTSPFVQSLGGAAVSKQRIFGAGVGYDFSFVSATLGYSNVLFDYLDSTGLRIQNVELALTKHVTPALLLGLAYIYTTGTYSSDTRIHYNQVNAGAVYSLSKRTDLFLTGSVQRAGGAAQYAQIYSTSPSSSKVQIAVTSGIRIRF